MGSQLVTLCSAVSLEIGGGTITAGDIDAQNKDSEVQHLLNTFASVQEECWDKNDWTFTQDTVTGVLSTANSRIIVLSAISNLNFMKPLYKVRDRTNNFDLKEISKRRWDEKTSVTSTGTPYYYRRFGFSTTAAGVIYGKIGLDPRPTAAGNYEVDYPTTPPSLTSSTSRSPFPDDLLISGVLSRMTHYEGVDHVFHQNRFKEILDQLMTNHDTEIDYKIGSARMPGTIQGIRYPSKFPASEDE